MALSISWKDKIINVPKSYMTLIQASPEIRELPTNQFRLDLKSLEADEEGAPFIRTNNHNTEVSLGGIVYARTLEIINGYTVTFEDGQYIVNLTGSNNNILDVTNLNQVSVRPSNAAGLISNSAIEYSSYNGGVTVDTTSSFTGTTFPVGTPQQPVNNMADALLIGQVKGFGTIYILGGYDFVGTDDYSDLVFIGEGRDRTEITVDPTVTMARVKFMDLCFQSGTLDGESGIEDCEIINLNYVDGVIERCILGNGTIVLGNNAKAQFLDCWSGVPGTDTPIIDMGGTGQELILSGYVGGVKLINKTGADAVSIALAGGQLKLDATVTAGTVVVRGIGKITEKNQGVGVTLVDDELVNNGSVAAAVWNALISEFVAAGTFGKQVKDLLKFSTWFGLK